TTKINLFFTLRRRGFHPRAKGHHGVLRTRELEALASCAEAEDQIVLGNESSLAISCGTRIQQLDVEATKCVIGHRPHGAKLVEIYSVSLVSQHTMAPAVVALGRELAHQH